MLTIGFNHTDTPLVVDESGFTVPGHSWGVVDTLDPVGKAELDAGRLSKANIDRLEAAAADAEHPRGVEIGQVLAALADRKERVAAAEALDKDELLEVVDDADELPTGGDGKPSKADLVDEAVADATAADEDIAAPDDEAAAESTETPKKKTTSRSAAKK